LFWPVSCAATALIAASFRSTPISRCAALTNSSRYSSPDAWPSWRIVAAMIGSFAAIAPGSIRSSCSTYQPPWPAASSLFTVPCAMLKNSARLGGTRPWRPSSSRLRLTGCGGGTGRPSAARAALRGVPRASR
jgi:hypothetical protein